MQFANSTLCPSRPPHIWQTSCNWGIVFGFEEMGDEFFQMLNDTKLISTLNFNVKAHLVYNTSSAHVQDVDQNVKIHTFESLEKYV